MNEISSCYIVLGMHRSGTSLVAGILSILGVFLGDEGDLLIKTAENPYGYFEHKDVMVINDDILAVFGGTWDNLPELQYGWQKDARLIPIRQRIEKFVQSMEVRGGVWGIKDPRLAITLPLWQEYLPVNTQYVVTYRNPIEIWQSLRKRNDITAIRNFFSLWSRTYASIQEYTSTKPHIYISYDLLHMSLHKEVQRLVGLDRSFYLSDHYKKNKEDIDQLFDVRLRRNTDMSGYVVSVYNMSEQGFSSMLLCDALFLYNWLTQEFTKENEVHIKNIQSLEEKCSRLEQKDRDIVMIQEEIIQSKEAVIGKMDLDRALYSNIQQILDERLGNIEKRYAEKNSELTQLLVDKQERELELQRVIRKKEERVQDALLEKEVFLNRLFEKDQYIISLQQHIQSLERTLDSVRQVLQKQEDILTYMQKNRFSAKMKGLHARTVWVMSHPLIFLKNYIWRGIPTYLQINWMLTHPLKFTKKHIWRGTPTYSQVVWAVHNPKKFFEKYFLRRRTRVLYTPPVAQENIKKPRIAVIAHIFYEEMWDDIWNRLQYVQEPFHLIITLTKGHYSKDFIKKIKDTIPHAKVLVSKNQGLDLLPFVRALAHVPKGTQFILKIHTKKSTYNRSMGMRWYRDLMDHVLLNEKAVDAILHNLEYSDAGMIGGSHVGTLGNIFSSDEVYEPAIEKIYSYMGEEHTQYSWISGSIFWVRYDILEKVISKNFVAFLEKEQPLGYIENGTIIHGLERYMGKLVYDAGKMIYEYPQNRYSNDHITLLSNNYSVQNTKKIYLFFHICCLNNYAEIVHTMIQSMQDSGLYDTCEEIYYTLVGHPTDSFLQSLKAYTKMKCVYTSPHINEVEYPLLAYLQEFSCIHDGYLFYCHTKGVSQPEDPVKKRWRDRLVEKNIKEYQTCVAFLNKGCDIAGCGWKEHPVGASVRQPFSVHTHSHFSGNFWWAQSTYIRTLPSIRERELELHDKRDKSGWAFESYRLECEMWIGQSEKKYIGVNTDLNIDYTIDFFDQK
jgi:hypothetical protein